jgi:hypothetical protein
MSEKNLQKYINSRTTRLLDHFNSSQNKYNTIWAKYERQMPQCMKNCATERANYSEDICLDGPQGIYWIGESPKILFVGREHFGWYGATTWDNGRESICYASLEFSFYTIASMGTYWAVIKELISDVLKLDLDEWDNVLKNVAFTNACKCLTNNRTLQWYLHQECSRQSYLIHEIQTIAAPLNVLFTRSVDLSGTIFRDKVTIIEEAEEFFVQKLDGQVIIECAHPGRQSREWRDQLKQLMAKYLENAESGKGRRFAILPTPPGLRVRTGRFVEIIGP